MADWYLERKGCVSLEQREEERAECRRRLCWQVDRAEVVGLSLMVSVLCRRWVVETLWVVDGVDGGWVKHMKWHSGLR